MHWLFLPTGGGFNLRAVKPSLVKRVSMAATDYPAFPEWPATFDNSLLRSLRADPGGRPHDSREVRGAHYVRVPPTVTAPTPSLVIHSEEVAEELGMSAADAESEAFLRMFSGSLPPATESWATAYGASFAGQYGGQRGDGRAISIGQVGGRWELQLKGAGTTPFSRQFDGRAVLRSCVREFLASEAMAALGVPTTRALAVVSTGERIMRRWYDEEGYERGASEPGAVGTRVAASYLRFGQLELFAQRGEVELLAELAQHALEREFGHLLVQHPDAPLSAQLVRMYAEVCERQARLVAAWLRVGYCQGNMNSDNSALGGVTLDYGPFAFMERFNPLYNPWVGGGRPYCFGQQPQAAAVNLAGLAEAFAQLLGHVAKQEKLSNKERDEAIEQVRSALSTGFVDTFHKEHDEGCRRKLGLKSWDEAAEALWQESFRLMSSKCGAGLDFTIFFRSLSAEAEGGVAAAVEGALAAAALQPFDEWPSEHKDEWKAWADKYAARVAEEGMDAAARKAEMDGANPKYILRNWMAAEAYEAAARGDYTIVSEVHQVLLKPYAEQGADADERWAQPTPHWARERPGLAYMS